MKTTLSRGRTLGVLGRLLAVAGAASLIALGGCRGNGKYTTKQKNAAKMRMEQMKSATEYQMAHQAFLATDLDKALRHVTYSLELNPEVVKSHVLKGRVLLEKEDLQKASDAFAEAERLDADFVEAWYYQGVLAERVDNKEEALRRYTGASERDGSNPGYAIAAAEMLISLDRLGEAEAFLTSRRENFRHSAGVRQTLGHIAMLQGKPDKAATLFEEARLLSPDTQAIAEDLVRAQIETGQFAQAELNLATMLRNKANAERRDLARMRGRCLARLDRPVEARDVFVTLTKDERGSADVDSWVDLGQVSYLLNDGPRLKSAAARVIAIAPARPEGYVLRALHLRSTGDLKGAEENLNKALERGRDAQTLMLLGLVQRDAGDATAAHASFAAAAAMEPANTAATGLLAATPEE